MVRQENFWQKYKFLIISSFLLFLLAIAVRSVLIFKESVPIFADEAIYIRWAQVMRAEPSLRFVPLQDGKQPLFMWSIIPFFKIFSDPLISGRMLSLFCGLLTLLGIIVLSEMLFKNRKVTIAAALLYAVAPFTVFFDSLALVDSMLSMFGLWTLIFAYSALKKSDWALSMLAGFALGGALLTKSPALYFALLLPVTLIFQTIDLKTGWKIYFNKALFLLPTYIIAGGMYNILRLGPDFPKLTSRSLDYVYPISHIFSSPLDPFLVYTDRSLQWIWLLGPGLLLIMLIIAFLIAEKEYWRPLLLLTLWTFVPVIVSAEYAKVFTARYIFSALPTFIIIAATVFLNKHFPRIMNLLLIMLVVHALIIDALFIFNIQKAPLPTSERTGYLEEWTSGYGIRQAADYLRTYQLSHPQDKIVIGTEGYFGTLPDGLEIFLNNYPQITIIGVGIDLKTVPSSLIEAKKAGNKTFLLINSTRLLLKPDAKYGVQPIAAYPKAYREKGTKEYNLYGPREELLLLEITQEAVNKSS